jgi:hypothetical protein
MISYDVANIIHQSLLAGGMRPPPGISSPQVAAAAGAGGSPVRGQLAPAVAKGGSILGQSTGGSAGRRGTSVPQLTARFATVVFLIVIHAGLIIWASTLAVSYLYRAGGVLRTTTRPKLILLLLRLLCPAARLHEHSPWT